MSVNTKKTVTKMEPAMTPENSDVNFRLVEHGSRAYAEVIQLREEVLKIIFADEEAAA